jgi:hypothetical protein
MTHKLYAILVLIEAQESLALTVVEVYSGDGIQ